MIKFDSRRLAAILLVWGVAGLAATARATVVDLTGNNNSGTANGAGFDYTPAQPTGTGVIEPFLRLQADPTEQGYNTSGGTPFDDKAGIWTHDIQFSDLQTTTVSLNGAAYFQILLDVNEPGGNKSLISLDRLEFYTSPVGSKTTTDVPSLGTLRWSLDGAADSHVLLDASRNKGSGSGDMFAFIPVPLLPASATATTSISSPTSAIRWRPMGRLRAVSRNGRSFTTWRPCRKSGHYSRSLDWLPRSA